MFRFARFVGWLVAFVENPPEKWDALIFLRNGSAQERSRDRQVQTAEAVNERSNCTHRRKMGQKLLRSPTPNPSPVKREGLKDGLFPFPSLRGGGAGVRGFWVHPV